MINNTKDTWYYDTKLFPEVVVQPGVEKWIINSARP
jgi:hypothetical protein